MSEFDEKMQKFFEDFKEQIPAEDGTATKVMERIKIRNNTIRRKRIFTLSIMLTLSFLIAMSSIVPVFGRNGTLPQLISGISLEKNATTFSGTIEAQSEVINELKTKGLSTSDSIIILALLDKTDVPVNKIIEMRLRGTGWGKIISDLGISLSTVQQTLEQASVQVKAQLKTQDRNQISTRTQDQIRDQEQTREQEKISEGNQGENQNQAGNGNSQSASNTPTSTVLIIKGKIKNINENIADEITVTGNNANKGNEEYELRSTVVSFDGTPLRIKDFGNDIIVNEDTKIEKEGSGRVDVQAIQSNDTLQIHIRYDGDKYYATNIVILTAPEHKNETFKGEVAIIDLTSNVVFLNGTAFIITDSTKSNKDLTEIKPGDEVEIVGTRVDANTVNIQNINVIKKGDSENNHGQSGKH